MTSKKFEQFTNQYALSKTLRFELKPVGETQNMLDTDKVKEVDGNIRKKYERIKPFFDKLHRDFVQEALSDIDEIGGIDALFDGYKLWKNETDKKEKKKLFTKLEKVEADFRKKLVKLLDEEVVRWVAKYNSINFKKKTHEFLFETPQVFRLLRKRYGKDADAFLKNNNGEYILDKDGEKISLFDEWDRFGGYFTKFFETRKNIYKTDGTSTALTTRMVNDNLRRFFDNIIVFESLKKKIDFSEVEQVQGIKLDEVFTPSYYAKCLLQDGIDAYNTVIGGRRIEETEEKIVGINEFVNKYRQNNKGERVQFLKKLDKQILSEKEGKLFEMIDDEGKLQDTLREFRGFALQFKSSFKNLVANIIQNTQDYDLENIYINKVALNSILRRWTQNTGPFEDALLDKDLKIKREKGVFKLPDTVPLSHIKESLNKVEDKTLFWKEFYYKDADKQDAPLERKENGNIDLFDEFLRIYQHELQRILNHKRRNKEGKEVPVGFDNSLPEFEQVLNDFEITDRNKQKIKAFLDDTLHLYQIAKYFAIEKKRQWNPENFDLDVFYTDPDFGYLTFYSDAYDNIVKKYNLVRNFLAKKMVSKDKWKLNFENATLAGGWDKNKEKDNSAVILRKDGAYYLAIMKKGHNTIFKDENIKDCRGSECYEKMVYKYFPGPNKMMPKVCFSQRGLDFLKPSDEIMRIYKSGTFKVGDRFNLPDMHKLIDFYKDALEKYDGWQHYDFSNLKSTDEYTTNIGEFYNDVATAGYKITWQNVSADYIHDKNKAGELYLFKIHNKDWNTLKDGSKKTGTKNLHTLYFESAFSEENAGQNFIVKLNGEAELFFRPKTSATKLIETIKGKEILRHKRYSEDKIFFHAPFTFNRTSGDMTSLQFNKNLNVFLANNPDINIIGIDRGEKHLAYYSVINQKGEILESGSLNKIGQNEDEEKVDYYALLTKRESERQEGRKSWQQIFAIKDLKQGYISQVVHKITELIIKYNAIVVLEDLNMRFKQIRGGIERSVYQQLERALIDKLSYLVNKKELNADRAGHILKAYQLTALFTTFKDMGKQTGIIFYTQAQYTSKIDPLTGWRPNLYMKKGNAKNNKMQILALSNIVYNSDKDRFEFTYDLKDFDKKLKRNKKEYPAKTRWTLVSSVERWCWDRKLNDNKGGYGHYENLTKEFKELFDKYNIDISMNILKQIEDLETKGNEKFFSDFIYLWNLVNQIRNTDGKLNDKVKALEREGKFDQIFEKDKYNMDFIQSPVIAENYDEPFDSRIPDKFGDNLPQNGDDNGAYNIARKGLIILERINKWYDKNKEKLDSGEKVQYPDLYISNTAWDDFATKNK